MHSILVGCDSVLKIMFQSQSNAALVFPLALEVPAMRAGNTGGVACSLRSTSGNLMVEGGGVVRGTGPVYT
jgi:hypothetical protein